MGKCFCKQTISSRIIRLRHFTSPLLQICSVAFISTFLSNNAQVCIQLSTKTVAKTIGKSTKLKCMVFDLPFTLFSTYILLDEGVSLQESVHGWGWKADLLLFLF